MEAVKDLSASMGSASVSFDKYCVLETIDVDEQQFCYNTNGIKSEVKRLLDLGADSDRICKKVKKTNPDFCSYKSAQLEFSVSGHRPGNRGIIYE